MTPDPRVMPTHTGSLPSDLCIVLCSGMGAHEDGWIKAHEIAGRLQRLGFEDVKGTRIGSTLARLCRMDAPPIERRRDPFGEWAYRITGYGATWLHNKLPAVWYACHGHQDRVRRMNRV